MIPTSVFAFIQDSQFIARYNEYMDRNVGSTRPRGVPRSASQIRSRNIDIEMRLPHRFGVPPIAEPQNVIMNITISYIRVPLKRFDLKIIA